MARREGDMNYRYSVFTKEGELLLQSDNIDEVNAVCEKHADGYRFAYGEKRLVNTLIVIDFDSDGRFPCVYNAAAGGNWRIGPPPPPLPKLTPHEMEKRSEKFNAEWDLYPCIDARHKCGHTHTRRLKRWCPFRKAWIEIPDLRDQDAPLALREHTKNTIKTLSPEARAYWRTQLCQKCWKEGMLV